MSSLLRACSLERAASFTSIPHSNGMPRAFSGAISRTVSASLPAGAGHSAPVGRCSATSRLGKQGLASASGTAQPRLPARQNRGTVVVACTSSQAKAAGASPAVNDPFLAASARLQSLLAGVGDGEAEMVDNYVSEEPVESRLSMQVVLAAAITGVSVTVSMLCGQDPWGGASLSLDSVMAAGVGLTACLPLVMLRAWTWSPQAAEALPALEDMHLHQLNLQSPWYSGSAAWHVATMVALEVLPVTLLLLPAAQGGLMASVHFYTLALQSLGAPGGASIETLELSCLALTAAGAAVTKGLELSVSDSEYEVVQAAVDNSDRYYRLMAMDMTSRASNANRAALAFRTVAEAWMDARNDASLAAMGLCALDVLVMGGLWYATGDLAAPAAAALAVNGVDAWNVHQAVTRREQLSMASGPGNGRGPKQSRS